MNSTNSNSKEGWKRPLTMIEKILEDCHENKRILMTADTLTINTKKPLQEAHVNQALIHLFRKMPTFSLCIQSRDSALWFREMKNEDIDFKVLQNTDIDEQQEYLINEQHYNVYNGPLWCARLIKGSSDDICFMPEVKEDFPFQCYILLGIHHSIADGITNASMCNAFHQLLDKVVAGENIDDNEQIGIHVDDSETLKLMSDITPTVMGNSKAVEEIKSKLAGSMDDCLFFKAFPRPVNVKHCTKSINRCLSVAQTSKFIQQCKKERVSVHSAICSLVHATIIQLLAMKGIKELEYKIDSMHLVNVRQYWQKIMGPITLGPHIGAFKLVVTVQNNILSDFWKHAKDFNDLFRKMIKEKECFREMAVSFSMMKKHSNGDIKFEAAYSKKFYTTTNMGNVSSLFSGEGEHVQVTNFRRTASHDNNIGSHVTQTFRGRLIYALDYGTSYMTKETAQLYVDTLFKNFDEVIL